MTQPEWDGEGVDPWLPTRLAHNEVLISGEKSIYDAYFAKLARWLVEVKRGLVQPYRIDPNSIWRYVPQWLREMSQFVGTTVNDLVNQAYRSVFGEGYSYDQRPYIVSYLAETRNRLAKVPDEAYDLVVGQIAEGATAGESIAGIAERIERVMSTTATPYWENRAVTVARTETLSAFNAGRTGAYQQVALDTERPYEQMWLATADARTRPTHRAADLQRVPLGQPFIVGGVRLVRPGDPKGPPQEVVNCRCTTLLLEPGEMVDLSNRGFTDF